MESKAEAITLYEMLYVPHWQLQVQLRLQQRQDVRCKSYDPEPPLYLAEGYHSKEFRHHPTDDRIHSQDRQ